jgi:hypothetical protein
LYWHNKATGLTADVPGEALLQPQFWGELRFVKARDQLEVGGDDTGTVRERTSP